MNLFLLFATTDPAAHVRAELENPRNKGFLDGDPIILAFAACLVIAVVLAWALYFRKPPQRVGLTPEEAAASLASGSSRRKRKNRFPTLAETGGLPPVKTKG